MPVSMIAASFAIAGEEPSGISARSRLQRVRGEARVTIRREGAHNRLDVLRQSGSAKVRLPRIAATAPLEAILLNTAGGVTGGDCLSFAVSVGESAAAIVSSQAAERAYRSPGDFARIETRLDVGPKGRLDWIPQETILFERSALHRRLEADVAGSATLLVAEAILLGRAAMGETLHDIAFRDAWRIRRDGIPVFADGMRLEGDAVAVMAGGATGGSAGALATVVVVTPDAETLAGPAREALAGDAWESGVSAWNGMLVARMLAAGGQTLRLGLTRLLETLRGTGMPRVWNC
ncbi:MAG: urease accessory protein UreD [Bauldia sp.]|uniref:urease accessory protein UreD n=1 Tax=Bauldia sp. TaxID=2575872 RepID=UPI001DCD8052|nr:urease accessory protein UreD [Bauldia sp.]MCB1494674.1 urease accessory protein UreD [Bauldia sp.]